MPKVLTFEEQMKEFRKVHGQKYKYIKDSYVNNISKMEMICPVHGSFLQYVYQHKRGSGCQKCFNQRNKNKTMLKAKKEILDRLENLYQGKYDFSSSEIIDMETFINVKCKHHGIFRKTPWSLLRGDCCGKCKALNKNRLPGRSRIEKCLIENNISYEYNKVFKSENTEETPLYFAFYIDSLKLCIENIGILFNSPVISEGQVKNIKDRRTQKIKRKKDFCKKNKLNLLFVNTNENSNIRKIIKEYIDDLKNKKPKRKLKKFK